MENSSKAPLAIKMGLQEFLQRRRVDLPISMSAMMQRTRDHLPDLALTDDELEHVIAEEIIANGGNIAFDRRTTDFPLPKDAIWGGPLDPKGCGERQETDP